MDPFFYVLLFITFTFSFAVVKAHLSEESFQIEESGDLKFNVNARIVRRGPDFLKQQQEERQKQAKLKQQQEQQQELAKLEQQQQQELAKLEQQQEERQQQLAKLEQELAKLKQQSPFMKLVCSEYLSNHEVVNGLEISGNAQVNHIEWLYSQCGLKNEIEDREYLPMQISDLPTLEKYDFIFLEDPMNLPSKFPLIKMNGGIIMGHSVTEFNRFIKTLSTEVRDQIRILVDQRDDIYFLITGDK